MLLGPMTRSLGSLAALEADSVPETGSLSNSVLDRVNIGYFIGISVHVLPVENAVQEN